MRKLLVYVHGFGGSKYESRFGKALAQEFLATKNVEIWRPRWGAGDPGISAWKTILEFLENTIKHGPSGVIKEIMKLFGRGSKIEKAFLDAQAVGRVFGALLGTKLLPEKIETNRYDKIAIIGFSLGTECTIHGMAVLPKKYFDLLTHVILCGGTVNSRLGILGERRNHLKGKVFNFYSKEDRILQLLFQKVAGFSWKPAGLYPLEDSSLGKSYRLNVGHFEYERALPNILGKSGLNKWINSP